MMNLLVIMVFVLIESMCAMAILTVLMVKKRSAVNALTRSSLAHRVAVLISAGAVTAGLTVMMDLTSQTVMVKLV